MPTRYESKEEETVIQAMNQMMRGPKNGIVKATDEQKELFKLRYAQQIRWVAREIPRCSSPMVAVITKCLIKYGEKKVSAFTKAFRNCLFDGKDDPVYVLWKFIQKDDKKTLEVYKKTVTVIRAYMEGRKFKNIKIKPAQTDIFKWNPNWTIPDDLIQNWNPESLPGLDPKEKEKENAF